MKLLELKERARAEKMARLEEQRRARDAQRNQRAQAMEVVDDLVAARIAAVTGVDRDDLEKFLTVYAADGNWNWDGSLVMNGLVFPTKVTARIKIRDHMSVETTLNAFSPDSSPTTNVFTYRLEDGVGWWTRSKKHYSLADALCAAEIESPIKAKENDDGQEHATGAS